VIRKGEGGACNEPTKGTTGRKEKEFRKCSKIKSIQALWGGMLGAEDTQRHLNPKLR